MSQITKINGVPIANTSVSAFTYDNNVFTIDNTNGTSYSALINSVTGLTFSGNAIFSGGNITNPDYIQFNTTVTGVTNTEGKMWWDEPNGTASLGMNGGNVSQQIGLEYYYYVKNQSGATIENGRVVRAAGVLGASSRILGEYMIADGSIPAKYTLGIATEDIVNGDDGYVTEFGVVRGINTTGSLYGETWNDGDILYVSTTIPGGLTKVEPSTPDLKIEMAIVLNAHTNGSLFVRPNRYPSIRDLQDIKVSGATNLSLIQYNSSLGYWESTPSPILSGLTATTISATTYQGLPTDVYVTGGTYSHTGNSYNNNSILFSNTSGGSFTVLNIGDTYTTGGTHSSGTITLTNNSGGTVTITGVTGTSLSKIVIDFGFDATYSTTSTSFAQAPMTISILSASTYNSSLSSMTAILTCDISQSTAGIAGEFDLFDLTDGVTVTSSATAFVNTDNLKSSSSFSIPSARFNHVFRVRIRRTGGVGSDTMRIREAQLTLTLS